MGAALAVSGRASERRRMLPAELTRYLAIALLRYRGNAQIEVLRMFGDGPWAMTGQPLPPMPSGTVLLTLAHQRLGIEPQEAFHRRCVRPPAIPDTPGRWFHEYRLLALEGSSISDTRFYVLAGVAPARHQTTRQRSTRGRQSNKSL